MGYLPKRRCRRTEREQSGIGRASALYVEEPQHRRNRGNTHRVYRNTRPAKKQERALSRLRTFIYDKEHQKYIDDIASRRKTMVSTGDRSAKIRTYNYPQGRITDHRINYTIYNLQAFVDGDIQDVIDQLTIAENAEKLKAAEL